MSKFTVLNTLESSLVMWYHQHASTQTARVSRTYSMWYLTENKKVPERNSGVPPVRNYYPTLNYYL